MLYFLEYYLRTLHSFVEFLGPCTNNVYHRSAHCSDVLYNFLALSRAALLGDFRRIGFNPLSFPAMTDKVGTHPNGENSRSC